VAEGSLTQAHTGRGFDCVGLLAIDLAIAGPFTGAAGHSFGSGRKHVPSFLPAASAGHQRYQDYHGQERQALHDSTRIDARATLTKRDFSIYGFAPQLEYSYIRNFSNDVLSRFDAHGLALTVTRAF
jgi:hypothetical protein